MPAASSARRFAGAGALTVRAAGSRRDEERALQAISPGSASAYCCQLPAGESVPPGDRDMKPRGPAARGSTSGVCASSVSPEYSVPFVAALSRGSASLGGYCSAGGAPAALAFLRAHYADALPLLGGEEEAARQLLKGWQERVLAAVQSTQLDAAAVLPLLLTEDADAAPAPRSTRCTAQHREDCRFDGVAGWRCA